ncbi:hypothetical protein [Angustibacter aerolatus]
MTLVDDIRTSLRDTTPVYAVVGATDLAVHRARLVREQARRIDLAAVPARLQQRLTTTAVQVPAVAVSRTLGAAGRAEEAYGELAERGRHLVQRVQGQQATQDLLTQANTTLARGRAVTSTVRKVVVDTVPAARATLTRGRTDAETVAADVRESATTRTAPTKSAAKRTRTTATKRAATARTTAKSARTSARTTASTATKATKRAAAKVGD